MMGGAVLARGNLRIATLSAAAVLATIGLAAVRQESSIASVSTAHSRCAQVAFYGVRGSGDHGEASPLGPTIRALARAVAADLTQTASVSVTAVSYPAVPVLSAIDGASPRGVSYLASRARGVAALSGLVERELRECPSTPIVLAGYSQGADVIGTYLNAKLPAAILNHVAGVALISDPRFAPADRPADAGSFSSRLGPLFAHFPVPPNARHAARPRPDFPRALGGRVISACNQRDMVCNFSPANAASCLGRTAWRTFYHAVLAHRAARIPVMRRSCASVSYSRAGLERVRPGQPVTVATLAAYLATRVSVRLTGWQTAIQEPGSPAPNKFEYAAINSVACGSPSNCVAGGYFRDQAGLSQAFTASEVRGTWGAPAELPGMIAVAPDGNSQITAVACGSAGNCIAGGTYWTGLYYLPFVDSETHGTWSTAVEAPGIASYAPTYNSEVTAASCVSAGNCLIGGYVYSASSQHAFILSQVGGAWGTATDVPGVQALNTGASAAATTVSCVASGACAVGGYFTTSQGQGQVPSQSNFVVSESHGAWGSPVILTGAVTGAIASLSCSSAGNCAATGGGDIPYTYPTPVGAYVATEQNGSWSPAIRVPGTSSSSPFLTGAGTVSCGADGNCAVGGNYWDGSAVEAFVATEAGGSWHTATAFPSIATLNKGREADITSVACASAGNCVAGGYYLDQENAQHAFLVTDVNGRWGIPVLLPGLSIAAGSGSGAEVYSIACPAAGQCVGGGSYSISGQHQGFVVSQG